MKKILILLLCLLMLNTPIFSMNEQMIKKCEDAGKRIDNRETNKGDIDLLKVCFIEFIKKSSDEEFISIFIGAGLILALKDPSDKKNKESLSNITITERKKEYVKKINSATTIMCYMSTLNTGDETAFLLLDILALQKSPFKDKENMKKISDLKDHYTPDIKKINALIKTIDDLIEDYPNIPCSIEKGKEVLILLKELKF